ncbi:MAG: hypothetical protein PVSMB4_14850 [Ktedonobacterales bacterium]
MSELWSELVTNVTNLMASRDAARLVGGAGLLFLGVVALASLVALRRGRQARSHRRTPRTAGAGQRLAPPAPAGSEPRSDNALTTIEVDDRGQTPGPARGATTNPLRHQSEWHVTGRPAVPSHPIRSEVGAVSAVSTGGVAVAERQTGPLPVDLVVQAERAEAREALTASPDLEAQAEADYRRGHRLLAQVDGDRAEVLRRALSHFRRAQEVWTRDHMPERWAMLQNDIGRVYQELPDGDRAAHLRTAILHHQVALEVFDPLRHPMNWAWTQSALGAAYQNLPVGSAVANARAAIAYHQRALDVFTAQNAPLAWAWNQNNLGTAFEAMPGGPEGGRVEQLREAARAYEAALEVYTTERYPAQHQVVTRNLARVQAELKALE